MRAHKDCCLVVKKADYSRCSNACRTNPIQALKVETASSAGLRLSLLSLVLATLSVWTVASSAWGAAPVEKGISGVIVVDYHTVDITFEAAMDLTTVVPVNIKVTDRNDPLTPLGTIGVAEDFHPTRIEGLAGVANTYRCYFSGEMKQDGAGIVVVTNMRQSDGTPVDYAFYWIDGVGVRPTASPIVCAAPTNPTGLANLPFTVSFSEPVQFASGGDPTPKFDYQDLAITTGTGISYSTVAITGGPQTYTVTFNGVTCTGAGCGSTPKPTFKLAFKSNPTIIDLAGNAMVTPIVNSATVGIDQVKPNVTSVTCPDPTGAPVFTVTFDKDVVGFNDPGTDMTIVKEVDSTLSWALVTITGGPRVFTAVFSGTTGQGRLTAAVNPASDIRDAAGNPVGTYPLPLTVSVDTSAPQVPSITAPNPGPTSSANISFNVIFTEPVYDFVPADILVSGAGITYTEARITSGLPGDTNYTVQVRGVAGTGTMNIRVKTGAQGGSVHDLAGNKVSYSAFSDGVIIDHTGPQATSIISQSGNFIQGGSVPFLVAFNESVKNFDSPNDLVITATGSVSYAGVGVSGGPQNYTATIASISGEGTLTLAVSTRSMTGMVADISDNPITSSVTSATVTVDITRPRATAIAPITVGPTKSTTASFSVSFSEPVLNFTGPAALVFTETGTAAHTGAAITGGPQDFTVNLTGVSGTGTIALAANKAVSPPSPPITDRAGNSLDDSVTSAPLAIDNTMPAVTVNPLLSNFQTPTLTGTVSDNFGVGAVNVTVISGHTHAATVNQGAGTWSIVWPETLPQGTYDVVAAVTDTAGNTVSDSTTNELTVDTTPPTVTVNAQTTGDSTPYVSGTVSDNIGVASVTFTVTISGTPRTYTATVSGGAWNGQIADTLPNVSQVYDIQVTATDTAGNTGQDATTGELNFDINVPTVHVDTLFTSNSSPTVTGSASFVSPATAISTINVTVHGNALAVTLDPPVGNTQSWTAPVAETLSEGIYDVVVEVADDLARPGRDGSTNELNVDKQGPTATFTPVEASRTNADILHMTVTFSEPLASPLDVAGVVLSGTLGTAATVAVSETGPTTYSVEITLDDPNANGTLGVGIADTVTDRALNPYAGGTSPEWTVTNWCGFIKHPVSAPKYNGAAYTFQVQVCSGAGTPVYVWKWDNGAKTIEVVGTDSPDLEIPDVTGKGGTYWCEVTYDEVTYSSNKATLFVAAVPSIVQEPQDAAKTAGESCSFSVVATGGFPPLSYEWFKDGQRINTAAGNSLSFARVTLRDAGKYRVIVTDLLGTPVQSREATLEVTGQLVPAAGLGGLAALAGALALMGVRSNSRRRK